MNTILHITTQDAWQTAVSARIYRADSFDTEGFIHCSTPEQVLKPANAMFQGQQNLILLCIDPDKLEHQLVYEDCYESGIEFPHVYGPINVDSVFDVIGFPPNADGTFSLPTGLKS